MKVFFSHASEDKEIVEQIYLRICEEYPEIISWLDKYEIYGGDDLIEKIHSGISAADKFLIFLSQKSIDKPWVRTELKKALADEISGTKNDFIIPIKLGAMSFFPPFLENRFYIDIETKTQNEWLQEIYAAIYRSKKPAEEKEKNISITISIASDNPRALMLFFEAKFWAEPISFRVDASARIKSTTWQFPSLKGMHQISLSELKGDDFYAIAIRNLNIKPNQPFIIGIEFEDGADPGSRIKAINNWDGIGGSSMMVWNNYA